MNDSSMPARAVQSPGPGSGRDDKIIVDFQPLPARAQLDEALAAAASPWLDAYVAFSRMCSPRSYEGYHYQCAIWLLSTICARRISLPLGAERIYPSLYLVVCGRTSVFAKSTAAKLAVNILRELELSALLLANEMTPQVMVSNMAEKELKADSRLEAQQLISKARYRGQRAWRYDEFGQKLSQMMRPGSYMGDFHGLLREFADCPPDYVYETRTFGREVIVHPYLSILASMTPTDAEPFAQRHAPLWRDGFWARCAFMLPPPTAVPARGRLPTVAIDIPPAVRDPLKDWHDRLGEPVVEINEVETREHKVFAVVKTSHPEDEVVLGDGVYDAFYAYSDALLDLINGGLTEDLAGSYARLPQHALRVAMLLGSLENDGRVELRHWAKAQEIAEWWRASVHTLYLACTRAVSTTRERTFEDAILEYLAKVDRKVTAREFMRHIRGLDSVTFHKLVPNMQAAGLVHVLTQVNRNGTETIALLLPVDSPVVHAPPVFSPVTPASVDPSEAPMPADGDVLARQEQG